MPTSISPCILYRSLFILIPRVCSCCFHFICATSWASWHWRWRISLPRDRHCAYGRKTEIRYRTVDVSLASGISQPYEISARQPLHLVNDWSSTLDPAFHILTEIQQWNIPFPVPLQFRDQKPISVSPFHIDHRPNRLDRFKSLAYTRCKTFAEISSIVAVSYENTWMYQTKDSSLTYWFSFCTTFSISKHIISIFLSLYKLKTYFDFIWWCSAPSMSWLHLGWKYTFSSSFAKCSCLHRSFTVFFSHNTSLSGYISSLSDSALTTLRFDAAFVMLFQSAILDKYYLNIFNSNSTWRRVEISFSFSEAHEHKHRLSRHCATSIL